MAGADEPRILRVELGRGICVAAIMIAIFFAFTAKNRSGCSDSWPKPIGPAAGR